MRLRVAGGGSGPDARGEGDRRVRGERRTVAARRADSAEKGEPINSSATQRDHLNDFDIDDFLDALGDDPDFQVTDDHLSEDEKTLLREEDEGGPGAQTDAKRESARKMPDWPLRKWAVMLFVAGCVVAKIILWLVR